MKYTIQLCLLFFGLLIISCGDEDACTTDDWAGTWSGSIDCDDGTSEEVAFTITKVDENTVSMNFEGETFEFDVNGCDYRTTQSVDFGLGAINVEFEGALNGSAMDFTTTVSLLGQSISCSGTVNK